MLYTMFQQGFVPKIMDGSKNTTIRSSGMPLGLRSARHWAGAAYRSKQVEFGHIEILAVELVQITPARVIRFGKRLPRWVSHAERSALLEFAQRDGFESWDTLVQWFEKTHSLPYQGYHHTFRFSEGN